VRSFLFSWEVFLGNKPDRPVHGAGPGEILVAAGDDVGEGNAGNVRKGAIGATKASPKDD
jgi:hypothetical protein